MRSQGFIQPRGSERPAQAQCPGKNCVSGNTRAWAQSGRALEPLGARSCVPSSDRGSLSSFSAPRLSKCRREGTPVASSRRPRPFLRCFAPGSPFLGNSRFPGRLRGRQQMRSAAVSRQRSRRCAAGDRARGLGRSRPQAGGGHPLITRPGLAPGTRSHIRDFARTSPHAGAESVAAGARVRGPWGRGAGRGGPGLGGPRLQLWRASALCPEALGRASRACTWSRAASTPPHIPAPIPWGVPGAKGVLS